MHTQKVSVLGIIFALADSQTLTLDMNGVSVGFYSMVVITIYDEKTLTQDIQLTVVSS